MPTIDRSSVHPGGQTNLLSVPSARSLCLLLALFLAIYGATLFTPALLDDADATHASAALHIAQSGDWVTLKVDGIRYLEKPPLPYWMVAINDRIFCIRKHSDHGYIDTYTFNEDLATFAAHLPATLAVLLLAALGYWWALLAWGERSAFYTGLGLLTATGVFLFTRFFIPEAVLSLFLCAALFCFLRGLDRRRPVYFYGAALLIALAVLTKGLIAPIFFLTAVFCFLFFTGELHRWRELRIVRCTLLFLLVAAPWHVLAGVRNRGGMNGHGFFWFYFINEHVLRFLGRRYPMDYNKLPATLYWSLHLVWLFPWSFFIPLALIVAWRKWKNYPQLTKLYGHFQNSDFAARTTLLLLLYSAIILVFFSFSTNQEYYTFPVYLPLTMLLAAALARYERQIDAPSEKRWVTIAHAALTITGTAVAAALCYGLWSARHLPFVPDIGDLLAHRAVGNYTLSMSHFFDLTGPSFAALRLPAALAAAAFAIGPAAAWRLRTLKRHLAATTAIGLTAAVFLIAAHIALVRFEPMLSSRDLADHIEEIIAANPGDANAEIDLYGDQSYGSSIPFYTGRQAYLVNGRTSSMLWGSTYADAPHIFLTTDDLLARWGTGARKFLFVPMEERETVDAIFATRPDLHLVLLGETSGKALITDRPLAAAAPMRK